jgi:hypothetical protein
MRARCSPARSKPDGLLLKNRTRFQQLQLPRLVHLKDLDACAGPDLHQSLAGETLQRFAHWRPAEAGHRRDARLGVGRVWNESAGDDELLYGLVGLPAKCEVDRLHRVEQMLRAVST